MLLRSRPWRIALLFGLAAAFIAHEVRAADTGAGSKNFNPPNSVPNYFSNEAGPLQGPASETRRGPLYMNQAYGASQAAAVVAAPRSRQHLAMAVPRVRAIRGRVAYERRGRAVAERRTETRGRAIHHVVAHGRPVYRAVAHAGRGGHVERVAARAHTIVHKTTQVSSAHRHGRG